MNPARHPHRNIVNNSRRFGMGATNLLPQVVGSGAAIGATAIAAGAQAGSLAGPIGTAVGAVVGAAVTILTRDTTSTASHIGSWEGQIVQAIGTLPASAAGIGRQIPWNENSHGLVQLIEALLGVGAYMAWDTSLKTSYDVAAHWAMTFGAAVQAVAQAVASNPAGANVAVSIALAPGAGGHPPFTFHFVNPGIQVGPDKISATVIMGPTGLMGAMMTALGGQNPNNIVSNENNPSAQKVYALMLDYWFAQYHPAASTPSKPVPVIAPAVAAASAAANKVVSTPQPVSNIQPIASAPTPNVSAQQTPQQVSAAAPNIVVNVPGQQPQFVQQSSSGGLSNTTILLIGGVGLAVYLMSKQ